jgi:hypothetical protein
MYAASGIEEQISVSLAQEQGLLCKRGFPEGNGVCSYSITPFSKTASAVRHW